jgi:hypothetical protein
MIPKNPPPEKYWYRLYEGFELRCQRRLHKYLGVDEAATETILHLRNQILELQSRIHQLEAELTTQVASQQLRLASFREACYEATWIELEFQE